MARKYPGWVPDPAGEPENPGRPLYCLPEYSPRVWIGGRMCVTHTCGLAGAAGGGTPQNLVPAGMFNGHPPHVWVVLLGPSVRDASRGSQRYRGEVRLWANRPCPVCPAGLAPPTPCGQGCHQLQSPNHGDPRGARRVKSTGIGVGFPPVFRPVRSDLFLERCRAIFR